MYVITGASGNTGRRIAAALLAAGKSVTVVSRQPGHVRELVSQGAQAAIGDLADSAFLKQTFAGAKAVYLVIPPKWDVTDWRAFQREITENFVNALRGSGVTHAVVLSSMGAHLVPEGAGPVSGLGELEQALQAVDGLHVLNLRPGFFMENFFANIGLMKQAGVQGYALRPDLKMPLTHTRDIADVATKHLLALDFTGHSHEFIGGAADYTMPEATSILAQAVGQEIQYVPFTPEQAKQGMMGVGIPETIADGYNELFAGLNADRYLEGFVRTPENTTPTTLEQFAQEEFAPAYRAS
jgi:uncharacterized protein YbjT (DUF2867 family)